MSELKRYGAMQNMIAQPNSHAFGVMNVLKEYYPAFAKKVFQNNPLMEKMAMANFSSMDILLYPVCGRCEALAAYCRYAQDENGVTIRDEDGRGIGICRCLKCGAETYNPVKFYDWCLMELKKKAPADVGMELLFAVDLVADKLMQDAKKLYRQVSEKEKVYVQP